MLCYCSDSSNKPNEIPISQWLIKDKEYTIIGLYFSKMTGDSYFKLAEIQPPIPYGGYNVKRFSFKQDIDTVVQEIEDLVVEKII